eukprot:g5273.t1
MNWTALRKTHFGDEPRSPLPPRVKLPVLPHAAMEFSRKSQHPDATPDELGLVVESDSGLTCDLLRHVNSAAFGLRQKVGTAKHAIATLGIRESRLFLLSNALSRALRSCESKLIDLKSFAAVNLERALFAKEIAGLLNADADLAFAAGMLADFILPVVTNQLFPSYYEFTQLDGEDVQTLIQFERSSLGWDHANAAAQVMFCWGFPDDLICCVLMHHYGMKLLADKAMRTTAAAAVAIACFMPDPLKQDYAGIARLRQLEGRWSAFRLDEIAERVDAEFSEMSIGMGDHQTLLHQLRLAAVLMQMNRTIHNRRTNLVLVHLRLHFGLKLFEDLFVVRVFSEIMNFVRVFFKIVQLVPRAVQCRWLETKRIEGVTEGKGYKYSEGGAVGYLHKKPALVVTAAEVEKVKLSRLDFRKGLFSITIHLTKDAKKKLAANVRGRGKEMRLLSFVIEGKKWGPMRYEIDQNKRGVPPQCRAKSFTPLIGFFPKRSEAQRIVDALTPKQRRTEDQRRRKGDHPGAIETAAVPAIQEQVQHLKNHGIATTTDGILEFLRRLQASSSQQKRELNKLIGQLSSARFAERTEATRKLLALGRVARARLMKAARSKDKEVAYRSGMILKRLDAGDQGALQRSLILAAFRILKVRKQGKAVPVLLRCIPGLEEAWLADAAFEAVWASTNTNHAALLQKALSHENQNLKAVAIVGVELALGEKAVTTVSPYLQSKSSLLRLAAARSLIDRKPRPAIAALVGLVGDANNDIAWQADALLQTLTGKQMQLTNDVTIAKAWHTWSRKIPATAKLNWPLGRRRLDLSTGRYSIQEDFARQASTLAKGYGLFRYSADNAGKARVTGGKLLIDGANREGDQRVDITSDRMIGHPQWPRNVQVRARLGGTAGNEAGWHVGVSVGRVKGMNRQTLLAKHNRWLRTVVLARTGSADAVDEVMQEVAVAFVDEPTLTDEATAPWLYRVAAEIRFCLTEGDLRPCRIFDVQLAEGFQSRSYPLGYSALVSRVLRKRVHGKETRTDWRKRPLSQRQIDYALEDVRYLPEIWNRQKKSLSQQGRLDWVYAEFDRQIDDGVAELERDSWARLPGINRLNAREFAVVCALADWREQEALNTNRPARRILRDDLIVELGKRQPKTVKELMATRDMNRSGYRKSADDFLKVIQQAKAIPDSELPAPPKSDRSDRSIDEQILGQFLGLALSNRCSESNISKQLVGTSADLRQLRHIGRKAYADCFTHPAASPAGHRAVSAALRASGASPWRGRRRAVRRLPAASVPDRRAVTMSEDRVHALVDRWEHAREQGETLSIDDLCTDCPELRDDVDSLIKRLKSLDSFLTAEEDDHTADDRSAGRYDVGEPLAAGGIGEIFVARDTELQREVVVKWLQKRWLHNSENRKRFEMEAEITGRLEHPGVIPVYGFGKNKSGEPYYAMRFVRGNTLEDAISTFHESATRDGSEFQTTEFQKLMRTFLAVCQTIAYAHSRKVVHRDIKPANIMLGAFGETLVVDWGLAKPLDEESEDDRDTTHDRLNPATAETIQHTIDGSAKGSPIYMSPEQARGDARNIRETSDVYSLGATLYLLMTGRRPIEGRNLVEYLEAVKQGQFQPPRAIRADVPKPLEAICLKAMRKNPADRYASAQELADDVELFLADEPVSAWTEPWGVRARRWVRKHRTMVVSSVVALVMAVLGLGFLNYQASVANGKLNNSNKQLETAKSELETTNGQLKSSITKEQAATALANTNAGLAALAAAKAQREKATADKLREAAEQDAYASRIALAHREYLAGRLDHSMAALLECPAKRRGWEWHRLFRLHHLHHKQFVIDQGAAAAIAIRPDGKQVAIAYGSAPLRGGSIDIYDVTTGKRLHRIGPWPGKILARIGHRGSSLGWSADGLLVLGDIWSKGILDGARTGFVEIWSTTGAKPKLVWAEKRDLKIDGRLVISPDARYFAWTHANGDIEIQNVRKPKTKGAVFSRNFKKPLFASRYRGQPPYLNETRLAFSETGDHLAVGQGGHLFLLESATGKQLAHKKLSPGSSVQRIAVGPEGDHVVVALFDRTIRYWNAGRNEEPLHIDQLREDVHHLAFDKTGRRIAAADALGIVRSWVIGTPKGGAAPARMITETPSHAGGARLVRFHPKDALLLTVGSAFHIDAKGVKSYRGELKAWRTDLPDLDLRRWAYVKAVAYSADGRHRVRLSSSSFTIEELATDAKIGELRFPSKLKFKTITIGGEKRTVLDTDRSSATELRFSPDGKTLAIWGTGWIRIYDWNNAKPKLKKTIDLGKGLSRYAVNKQVAKSVSHFDFEPDGVHAIVYLYPDRHAIHRLNLATGTSVKTWKTTLRLDGVEIHAPSRRAVLEGTNPETKKSEIRIVDLKTDKPIVLQTFAGYSSPELSPDGSRFAAFAPRKKGSPYRLEIRNVSDGKLLCTLTSPEYGMRCRFHPQGNRIAVWERTSTNIRVHDASTGRELLVLNPAKQLSLHKRIDDVRFSRRTGGRLTVRTLAYLFELNATPVPEL